MRYWNEAGLHPAAFIRTSSMEAVREMVALDLGVTMRSYLQVAVGARSED